ncbi:MAG: radical SAM protein [Lachnospiraceae bacterium]|nr:radical SAM protein [Lachnospiraceae bacterium]
MKDKFADLPCDIKAGHFKKLKEYKEKLYKEPELKSLFIEATPLCNENCLHCGSRCNEGEKARNATLSDKCYGLFYDKELHTDKRILSNDEILTDDEIISILEQLKHDMYTATTFEGGKTGKSILPFISVTGGEPLLRKGLPELMKRIRAMGYKWGMTSNGTLITPEVAKALKNAGMYSIGISLDGLRDTHDRFRQSKGSYDKAIEGIQNLMAAGQKNILVTTVVHKDNISALSEIRDVVVNLGIKMWRIINVDPIGRALDNSHILLDKKDYKAMIDYIVKERETDDKLDVVFSCNHYLGLEYERKTRPWYFFCRAGLQVASIQYNGDISACLDIERRPELTFGNVRKDNLYSVWKNEFKIFREPRIQNSKHCKACSEREYCGGSGFHTWDFNRNEPKICMFEELNSAE